MFNRIYEAFERMATAAELQAASVERQSESAVQHYAIANEYLAAAAANCLSVIQKTDLEIEAMKEDRERKKRWYDDHETKDRTKTESGRGSED